jgi:4-hydroxy-tetrahydrodipicolinate synthase
VNIVPDLMVGIYRAIEAGRPQDATTAAARMTGIGRVIDQLTFPQNVAAGLAARGFHPGVPKSILSAESGELAARITAELGLLFQEWRLTTGAAAAWAGNSGPSVLPFSRYPL